MRKTITIRIDDETRTRIIEAAKKKGVTLSAYIREELEERQVAEKILKVAKQTLFQSSKAFIAAEELCRELPAMNEKRLEAYLGRVDTRLERLRQKEKA